MTKRLLLFTIVSFATTIGRADWESKIRHGLPVSFCVHVTDENGENISNATCFAYSRQYGKATTETKALTDIQGYAKITAYASFGDVTFNTEARGYYRDYGRHCAFMPNLNGKELTAALKDAAEQGKWIPYKNVFEVTLKKRGNPFALFSRKVDIPIEPVENQKIWINLEEMSITNIAPELDSGLFLEGTVSYSLAPSEKYSITADYSVSLEVFGIKGGFAFAPVDTFSEYRFPINAPKDGYTNVLEISESISKNRITSANNFSGNALLKTQLKEGKNIFALITRVVFDIVGRKGGPQRAVLRIKYFLFPAQMGNDLEFNEIRESTYRYYVERGMIDAEGRLAHEATSPLF